MKILTVLIAVAMMACTVTRPEVHQRQASHTETGQDSGILAEDNGTGFLVNHEWPVGYDALLARYGASLIPPRKPGDREGISAAGNNYRVSDAVMERMLVLNQKRVNDE